MIAFKVLLCLMAASAILVDGRHHVGHQGGRHIGSERHGNNGRMLLPPPDDSREEDKESIRKASQISKNRLKAMATFMKFKQNKPQS